jgi:hypothetical protein
VEPNDKLEYLFAASFSPLPKLYLKREVFFVTPVLAAFSEIVIV